MYKKRFNHIRYYDHTRKLYVATGIAGFLDTPFKGIVTQKTNHRQSF